MRDDIVVHSTFICTCVSIIRQCYTVYKQRNAPDNSYMQNTAIKKGTLEPRRSSSAVRPEETCC